LSAAQDAAGAADGESTMPLSETEFAEAMAALGPFERTPALAVAVSGGADSLALCLLACRWAEARNGSVTALTVDHRLRSGSTSEAEQIGDWMKALAVDHRILPWCGPKPKTAIQEHSRRARYALLTRWCREAGVLHLLLGHHRRDQAETVAMRISRGSGEAGLAAMAGVVEMPAVRVLRPLLETPPARLRAFLVARDQPWVEDPSNRDLRFSRTAVRKALTAQTRTEATLARLAARMARKRVSRDLAAARVVAECVSLHPAGFAVLDGAGLASAPRPVGLTALQNVVGCIGGGDYSPSLAKIERIFNSVIIRREAAGGNLGGCRVLSMNGRVLVCREGRNLPAPRAAQPDEVVMWDDRFAIRFTSSHCVEERHGDGASPWLRPLGREGLQQVAAICPRIRHHPIPEPARVALPALADQAGIFSVPHLGFRRESGTALDPNADSRTRLDIADLEFRPVNPLAGAGCFLAYAGRHIM
jgi:tRNA(Ile)-lysidine synthase